MARPKRRGIGGPSGKKRFNQIGARQGIQAEGQVRDESSHQSGLQQLSPASICDVSTPLFDSLTAALTCAMPTDLSEANEVRPSGVDASDAIPMEFRAQVEGRCQRQKADLPDAMQWVREWITGASPSSPFTEFLDSPSSRTFRYQVDWRLISNAGTDEGIIRPVIAAQGWPIVPASGIKGLFRRGCALSHASKLTEWCGSASQTTTTPGTLRFHGAWPADAQWRKENLLDVAHPQQAWQIGFNGNRGFEKHNANAVISLLRPELFVCISSTKELSDQEWIDIRNALEVGLKSGIGGRTCAGYGSIQGLHPEPLLSFGLEGQGVSSTLLNRLPEFRPNAFRASIRGMALRLFSGLVDHRMTETIVNELFGGFTKKGPVVGVLGNRFLVQSIDEDGAYGRGQATFAAAGNLEWSLNGSSELAGQQEEIKRLLYSLHAIVMVLGGFGRGWRRPDHSLFRLNQGDYLYSKNAIGTHWQWLDPSQLPKWCHPSSPHELGILLVEARRIARDWLRIRNLQATMPVSDWREVLHPAKGLIWARLADGPDDASAINWFHSPDRPPRIKNTALTGSMGKVGHLWNRMYPLQVGPSTAGAVSSSQRKQATPDPFAKPPNPLERAAGRGSAPFSNPVPRQETRRNRTLIIDGFWRGPYLETVTYFLHARDRQAEDRFLEYMNNPSNQNGAFQLIDYSDP